jgi:hypothetical protein
LDLEIEQLFNRILRSKAGANNWRRARLLKVQRMSFSSLSVPWDTHRYDARSSHDFSAVNFFENEARFR